MRIFTEKDIHGLARAFVTFWNRLNGNGITIDSALPAMRNALENGLHVDVIFNVATYCKASEICPGMEKDDYLRMIQEREVINEPVTKTTGWDLAPSIDILADVFHSFFKDVTGTGGTYTTKNAISNLVDVLRCASLQDILSEQLINERKDAVTDRKEPYTCFLYIVDIRKAIRKEGLVFPGNESLSDTQMEREKSFAEIEQTDEGISDSQEEQTPEVSTESDISSGNDKSIYDIEDEFMFEPDIEQMRNEEEVQVIVQANNDIRQQKREAIKEIFLQLTPKELAAIARCSSPDDDSITLDELATQLTEGVYEHTLEDIVARGAHQYLNGELLPAFTGCVHLQGLDIDDQKAAEYDIMLCNWDLRSESRKKFEKLRQLVVEKGDSDPELLKTIDDFETMLNFDLNS